MGRETYFPIWQYLCHNAKVVHAFEANTPFEKLPGTQINVPRLLFMLCCTVSCGMRRPNPNFDHAAANRLAHTRIRSFGNNTFEPRIG